MYNYSIIIFIIFIKQILYTISKQNKTIIKIKVRPNIKVAYWSTLPNNFIDKCYTKDIAYGDYSNSGVVKSDHNGIALLEIEYGQGYYYYNGTYKSSHVHYKELINFWCKEIPIKTINL